MHPALRGCVASALLSLACGGPDLDKGEDGEDDGSVPGPSARAYAGYWSGSVGGREISFHVDEQGVLDSLIATLRIELGQGDACIGPFTAEQTVVLSGGRFEVPVRFVGGSIVTRITGSFSSPSSASGSVESLRGSSVSLACGSSVTFVSSSAPWTIVAGTSWTASPGAATCRWPGDGECDERAGTGLCLEGTDSLDCP